MPGSDASEFEFSNDSKTLVIAGGKGLGLWDTSSQKLRCIISCDVFKHALVGGNNVAATVPWANEIVLSSGFNPRLNPPVPYFARACAPAFFVSGSPPCTIPCATML